MSKKIPSRKQELNELRDEVSQLRQKIKINPSKNTGERLTKEDLNKKSVQQLRRIVVDNKLFSGISRMKKAELISGIANTDYFKSKSLPLPKGDRPTIGSELKKTIKEKQEIKKELGDAQTQLKKLETEEKKDIEEQDFPKTKEQLDMEEELAKLKKQLEELVKKEENIKSVPVITEELNIATIPPPPGPPTPPVPPAPPVPPIPAPPGPPKIEEIEDVDVDLPEPPENRDDDMNDASGKHKEGLTSHKEPEKQNVDVGHTIVNMYCGGSPHPDFPVPQSVVRQALDANNMSLFQQQQLGHQLRQANPPQFQGIPQEVIPAHVAHPSQESIKSRFNKPNITEPVKKFPPVKSAPRLEKPIQQTEPSPGAPKSKFDDEEEEEETQAQKESRERREKMEKEIGQSKGKGKTDKFKQQLENIFKAKQQSST